MSSKGINHDSLWLLIILVVSFSCRKSPPYKPRPCANIVYQDIRPNVTIRCPNVDSVVTDSSTSYYFDFNSDLINDIGIFCYSHYTFGSTDSSNVSKQIIISKTDSASAVNYQTGSLFSSFLSANTPIDNSLKWKSTSSLYNSLISSSALSQIDKFLPVRLTFNNELFYGWIRVDRIGSSLVLKEFAYNACAGKSINAGQKH